MQKTVCFSLPEFLVELVENVQTARHDPTRSDTVRLLLLKALSDLGYLKQREKVALMFSKATQEAITAD
jgi:metal-responsive CopG/Arc/MetJ family transcriptional regulator